MRRDHLLDRGITRQRIDRAMEINVAGDQLGERRLAGDGAPGDQRRLEPCAAARVGPGAHGGQPGCQRVNGATDFVELADALGIEPDHFKAAAAAFGDEALPVQQMQRMRYRLARHAKPGGELVLADALAGRQRAVDDRLENPRVNLVDQIGERVERDHGRRPLEHGIPCSEANSAHGTGSRTSAAGRSAVQGGPAVCANANPSACRVPSAAASSDRAAARSSRHRCTRRGRDSRSRRARSSRPPRPCRCGWRNRHRCRRRSSR